MGPALILSTRPPCRGDSHLCFSCLQGAGALFLTASFGKMFSKFCSINPHKWVHSGMSVHSPSCSLLGSRKYSDKRCVVLPEKNGGVWILWGSICSLTPPASWDLGKVISLTGFCLHDKKRWLQVSRESYTRHGCISGDIIRGKTYKALDSQTLWATENI